MASRQVPVNDLVTVDDIAKRWHMSVGQVSNIVCGRNPKKGLNFPQPVVGTKTRAVWLWDDVDAWYKRAMPKQDLDERRASKKTRKMKYLNQPLSA